MKREQKKSNIGGLLALLLFCVFAVCVLSILLTGADVYRNTTQRDQASFDRRTAAQYLATRVRQADSQGSVFVSSFDGCDALVLTQEIGDETYQTRVYCYDGYLRELFSAADGDFSPEDGEKVLEAQSLEAEMQDDLLTIRLTAAEGEVQQLTLYLRSGREAAA